MTKTKIFLIYNSYDENEFSEFDNIDDAQDAMKSQLAEILEIDETELDGDVDEINGHIRGSDFTFEEKYSWCCDSMHNYYHWQILKLEIKNANPNTKIDIN